MQIISLKSRKLFPSSNLTEELILSLKKSGNKLKEKDILVITSKAVALAQNCFIKNGTKQEWVVKEADKILYQSNHGYITIKDGMLMVNAGIDSSNVKNGIILYPKNLQAWTKKFWQELKKELKLKKLGLIITDSRTNFLRSGTGAIACAHAGFEGVEFLAGQQDVFNKKLRHSRVNKADMLANAAVVCMGESNEQSPFAIIRQAPVKFIDNPKHTLKVRPNQCIYGSLFTAKKR